MRRVAPRKALTTVAAIVEEHKTAFLLAWSVLFVALCILLSATRLMSNDELGTYFAGQNAAEFRYSRILLGRTGRAYSRGRF